LRVAVSCVDTRVSFDAPNLARSLATSSNQTVLLFMGQLLGESIISGTRSDGQLMCGEAHNAIARERDVFAEPEISKGRVWDQSDLWIPQVSFDCETHAGRDQPLWRVRCRAQPTLTIHLKPLGLAPDVNFKHMV
jgi:hypothetical protein